MKCPKRGPMIRTTKNTLYLLVALSTFLFHILYCFVIMKLVYLLEVPARYKHRMCRFMKIFCHHAIEIGRAHV